MNLVVHDGAKSDYQDAVDFYDANRQGFGIEFIAEIKRSFERIKQAPDFLTEISPNIRKCRILRLPFSIIYSVSSDEIVILAIMHGKRNPGYWKDRRA